MYILQWTGTPTPSVPGTSSGNPHSYNSVILPVYDPVLRVWRCRHLDGWDYRVSDFFGKDYVVIPPPPTTAAGPYPTLSAVQFYNVFQPDERTKITHSLDPKVQQFWALYRIALQSHTVINMNTANVAAGLQYCVTKGIIAPDRVSQILAGQL